MASDMPEPSRFTNFPMAADLRESKFRYVSGAEDVLPAGRLVVCPLVSTKLLVLAATNPTEAYGPTEEPPVMYTITASINSPRHTRPDPPMMRTRLKTLRTPLPVCQALRLYWHTEK